MGIGKEEYLMLRWKDGVKEYVCILMYFDKSHYSFNFPEILHYNEFILILFPDFRHLPKIYQSFVTSATMWDDVKQLKKLILNKPVILRLEEPPLPTTTQLTQYVIKVRIQDLSKILLRNVS